MEIPKIITFPYWQPINHGEKFVARMQESFRQTVRELSTPISVQTARAHAEEIKK